MLAKFTWSMSFTETTQTEATVIKTKRETANGKGRAVYSPKVNKELFQSVETDKLARATVHFLKKNKRKSYLVRLGVATKLVSQRHH